MNCTILGPIQYNICAKPSHSQKTASMKTVPRDITLNLTPVPLSAHCTHLGSRKLSHKRSECTSSHCPSQSIFFLPVSVRHHYLDNTPSNGTVTDNNELERMWKGAVGPN
jgi:hypothetical protein